MKRLARGRASLLAAGLLIAAGAASAQAQEGETLYNGIVLPKPWPPRPSWEAIRRGVEPPYLKAPPAVIPIDVGRQLFVDDFLVETTTLTRSHHQAEYHPGNPVVKPDREWEQRGGEPGAMPFSDGVWYDPEDGLFKMWYRIRVGTSYAVSRDGITWEKPELDVKPGTNIVQPDGRDSSTVWLDLEEADRARRFKMFRVGSGWRIRIHFSGDGIHWTPEVAECGPGGDRSTVFYNPFRKVWVFGLRTGALGRARFYHEGADLLEAAKWQAGVPVPWIGADPLDEPYPGYDSPHWARQLYNLDCTPYESLLLGLFTIWHGDCGQGETGPRGGPLTEKMKEDLAAGRPKINLVKVGFSRDGFHFARPDRRPFLGVSERRGDWNWGNVQSAGGGCLVVGDRLYFYCSGRAGLSWPGSTGKDAGQSTGLAFLRRDGFASMDAGEAEGTLTTRPVKFGGKYLFVNVECPAGELRAEVLDEEGRPIAPYTKENCAPVRADSTLQRVRWQGADDVAALAGRPVKFRFHLTNGRLYAFWVSPDESGASYGYVAAGGPGFTGNRDTVGEAAYRAAKTGAGE